MLNEPCIWPLKRVWILPTFPKAFVFSATLSVRPFYPIARNSFWAAGNTGNSPDRDEAWGQMYREVELRLEDDGCYHFVSMGTGAVGNSNTYEYLETPDPITEAIPPGSTAKQDVA